ncbi:hypothetical protein Hanom_Chr14g01276781 [Helianthus anomalus]
MLKMMMFLFGWWFVVGSVKRARFALRVDSVKVSRPGQRVSGSVKLGFILGKLKGSVQSR